MAICYRCGAGIFPIEPVSRGEVCGCGAYVRCCSNCEFFDEYAPRQCREPMSEPPSDKEMANFCDYFRLDKKRIKQDSASKTDDAKRRFEELFKKKP